jgi:alkanesulfonate monooxygenase SsuD/methylene tetrahydromethanopterin reductase-like flavin-dependent oxidoreductase (luciferase family)
MVGGNGPNVTWRLAARYADELNVDGFDANDVAEALPTIRARCEEIGRDPATLTLSVHIWTRHLTERGQARIDRLAALREQGVDRVIGLLRDSPTADDTLEALVDDAKAAGVELGSPVPA